MSAYETKVAERLARMRARAARLQAEGEARLAGAHATLDRIPLGQPILVGHHSEGKHRRDLARADAGMRKGYELTTEAAALARRADAAEVSTAVSSDDPDAVDKLRAKLADVERGVEAVKAANKVLRKATKPLTGETIREVAVLLDWSPERTAQTLGILASMGQHLLRTTNAGAERRRLQARIAELEARATAPAKAPEVVGEVRIEESDNRVRMYWPAKPSDEVRAALKGSGFRWSPTEGAWQRHASTQAWYAARDIAALVARASRASAAE
jgi:hypothetical protein